MLDKLNESYNNMDTIRTYGGETVEKTRFDHIIDKYKQLCNNPNE